MNNARLLGITCSCWGWAEVDSFLLRGLLPFLLFAWLPLYLILFVFIRSLVRRIFFACINKCLCLFLGLSFELRDNFIPIFCASLVSPFQFARHIYVMRLLFLGLFVFAVSWIENELFICKFKVRSVEVYSSTLWLTIGDRDINSVSLKDPLNFSCHFGNI